MQHSGETKRSDVAGVRDVASTEGDSQRAASSQSIPSSSGAGVSTEGEDLEQWRVQRPRRSRRKLPVSLLGQCIPFSRRRSSEMLPAAIRTSNKFTQTYYKFMQNLTKRRCVEILSVPVDHNVPQAMFYVSSCEMLFNMLDET